MYGVILHAEDAKSEWPVSQETDNEQQEAVPDMDSVFLVIVVKDHLVAGCLPDTK